VFHFRASSCLRRNSARDKASISLERPLASDVLLHGDPMSDISVTRHEKGLWTDEVFEALASLLGPGSGPGRAALEHELLRCDLLYLARDAEGPCAFLLAARVRLPVGPERRQARYLGLSVARSDAGAESVLERFTADARDEEESRGVRLVLFTAASSPVAVRTAQSFWADVQPAPDASFRDEVLPVADAARAWLGATGSIERPFVLPRLSGGGADWRRRLDDGNSPAGDLFRRLGIEQAEGDRLLLLCKVPGRERLADAQAA
jgi:hypothetical protein